MEVIIPIGETSEPILDSKDGELIRRYFQRNKDTIREPYYPKNIDTTIRPPSTMGRGSLPRVPSKLLKVDKDTYQPHIVAIGPYHSQSVDSMKFKKTYTEAYIQRSPYSPYHDYARQKLYEDAEEAFVEDEARVGAFFEREGRSRYEEPKEVYIQRQARYVEAYIQRNQNSAPHEYTRQGLYEEFSGMRGEILWGYGVEPKEEDYLGNIVDDGCFILELLIRYQEDQANMESKDSIFSTTWLVPALRRDLVLLENQIPFLVLDHLYELVSWPPHTPSLVQLILDFFDPILPTILLRQRPHTTKSKHILDLLRSHLVYPYQAEEDFKDRPTSESGALETFFELSEIMWFGDNPTWEYTTSATELQAAGVKFKKNDSADCLLDIRFTSRDGKLEMPPFFLGESWTVLFPNLVALEQCHRDYPARITSYVLLLHKLMSSPSDRKLLRAKGIIDGYSRKDEKVALVIGGLLQEVVVDKFYYDRLCNAINAYCCRSWNRWRRTLVRNFFNTPRQAVSSVAVAVLILLVSAQVVFTILS